MIKVSIELLFGEELNDVDLELVVQETLEELMKSDLNEWAEVTYDVQV